MLRFLSYRSRFYGLLPVLLFTAWTSVSYRMTAPPAPTGKWTLVLDPGHGGLDPGALAHQAKFKQQARHEKVLALELSHRVRKLFEAHDPTCTVKMTRSKDDFVRLYDRAHFANTANADMFISIHFNSAGAASAHGTETFAMGTHKNSGQLEVMKRENSSILLEENHEETYNGFDPTSEEATIMFKLRQHAFLKQSLDLATRIEHQFQTLAKRPSRGVKQAGFLVLWQTTMPAILIEGGFLSNPTEETYLNTAEGQDYLARSIYRAVKEYRQQYASN